MIICGRQTRYDGDIVPPFRTCSFLFHVNFINAKIKRQIFIPIFTISKTKFLIIKYNTFFRIEENVFNFNSIFSLFFFFLYLYKRIQNLDYANCKIHTNCLNSPDDFIRDRTSELHLRILVLGLP